METLRFQREIRWLLQAGLLIFLVTIATGMARGLGLLDFNSSSRVFTHLHSGVVGWITLAVLGAVLWLFGGTSPRQGNEAYVSRTTLLLIGGVPLFILAWWVDSAAFLAITGTLVLLGIVLFAAWLVGEVARTSYGRLTTPQLGAVVALVTLVIGSAIGVLIATQEAGASLALPGDAHGAHAETQISGYLILVAMSLAYWRLRGNDRTRRGTWMVWLLFAGGIVVAGALLASAVEVAILYIPLDVTAFALFVSLTWRRLLAPGWRRTSSENHYVAGFAFALVYLAIFIYLVIGFAVLKLWADIEEVPISLIAGSSHALFVGMVTNALFGLLLDLEGERRLMWAWANPVVFWGVTVGVATFTAAILLEQDAWFGPIASVMGLALLLGVAVHSLRLQARAEPVVAPGSATS